ncbi:fibronectin type III-like domain-contianing protein, partial [uncultured Mucilaginibacter sp.]|uniref:fibronectin type III-like domain-contianing protein n=1 Tax=uncultured Mucilaginibacter sp. TaxID=797541 RepID=UPI002607DA88
QLTLTINNTGKQEGAEVVQLYIRDLVSSVTRPVKELKAFQRVNLKPGETKTLNFNITPAMLAFYNIDMKYLVEPGQFELMVGTSSQDTDLQKVLLTVAADKINH